MEYQIDEIFYENENYSDRASWCNSHKCYIERIEDDEDGKARYQIKSIPVNEQQVKIDRIDILKQNLKDTDYQAIKHSEGLISEEDYAEMKAQRQSWRDEINELEKQLNA